MTKENLPYDPASADNAQKVAESMNNSAQDAKDDMADGAKKIADETPKTPEDFIKQKGFTAWQAAEKVRANEKNKKEEAKS